MVMKPLPDGPLSNFIRMMRNITGRSALGKKSKFLEEDIRSFRSAMATGRFDRASKMIQGGGGSAMIGGGAWMKAQHILNWLKELERGAATINSPLMDLFGPVQSDAAMRAMRMRRYLQDDGGI